MTAKRALFYGLTCWVLYIALRAQCVYLLPALDWPSYVHQDLIITLLRLGCGITCLHIARNRWFDSALGLRKSAPPSRLAYIAIVIALSGAFLEAWSSHPDASAPSWIRGVEVTIALIVAFNEEVGFRVLAYNGFRELAGRSLAVLLSALLFALMHIGYQPYSSLFKIFFVGLFLAFLRDRGVSLWTLILVHFLYDGIFGLLLTNHVAPANISQIVLGLVALAAFLAWVSPERQAAGGECLIFVYGSLRSHESAAITLGVPRRCDSLGTASISGTLTEYEGYPALVTARAVGENVPGEILRLRDKFLLDALDQYEGKGYRRDMRDVILPNEYSLLAWVYCKS